jgi:hypothetical protein
MTTDIYGRQWEDGTKTCPGCGQVMPDRGECHHYRMPRDKACRLGACLPPARVENQLDRLMDHGVYHPNRPFYIKDGRNYVCCGVLAHTAGDMVHGHYLMTVRDGSTSYRPIEPAYVEAEAAMVDVEEEMVQTLLEVNRGRPRERKMSAKERRAVKAYQDIMGDDEPMIFEGISMSDLVTKGLNIVRRKLGIKERHTR